LATLINAVLVIAASALHHAHAMQTDNLHQRRKKPISTRGKIKKKKKKTYFKGVLSDVLVQSVTAGARTHFAPWVLHFAHTVQSVRQTVRREYADILTLPMPARSDLLLLCMYLIS
jgi:hypothetical protein